MGSGLQLCPSALITPMRLLTLIKLSTAVTCPVLLLALPKAGSQPVNSSIPSDIDRDASIAPRSTAIESPVPRIAVPNVESFSLPQFSFQSISPRTPVTSRPPVKSQAKPIASQTVAFTLSSLPWDRIVERSLPASTRQNPKSSTRSTPTKKSETPVQTKPESSPNQNLNPSESLTTSPIDTPYVLGAGDTIQLTAVNVPEFSGQQQVGMDGSILLPVVGRVTIAGLTLPEAEAAIATRLSRELRRPRILITVLKSRPLRVGIAGEIKQPGFYTIASDSIQAPSIAQAIQTAGGLTLSANLQQIEIRRRDRTKGIQRLVVNLSDLTQAGDLDQNLALRDGDSIYIPAADTIDVAATGRFADTNLALAGQAMNVALVGEVNRPGAYKVEGGKEGARVTLTQAIQQAGGITQQADLRQVEIRRTTRSGQPRVFTVDVMKLIREGDLNQDVLLQSGDTIRLAKAPEMSPEDLIQQGAANVSPGAIRVNVVGEVKGGGVLQVTPGSTLNQAILAAGGLDRRAAKSVELIRLNPNGTVTRRSIRVDLSRGIDPANNPVLWNNDVIVVGRSGFTKFSDGLSDILSPVFRLLPLQFLF